jgi:type II secretory pathway component PulM
MAARWGLLLLVGRAWLGHVVVGLAQRAARAAAGQPRVHAESVEGMAAREATHVVVVFERVDANGARVAVSVVPLLGEGGRNLFVVAIVVFVGRL